MNGGCASANEADRDIVDDTDTDGVRCSDYRMAENQE